MIRAGLVLTAKAKSSKENSELSPEYKQRVRLLSNGRWYLEDFYVFQYGEKLNRLNRVHESILSIYLQSGVSSSNVRGLSTINDEQNKSWTPKKFDVNLRSIRGQIGDNQGIKDKDKDIDKEYIRDSEFKKKFLKKLQLIYSSLNMMMTWNVIKV